MKGIPDLINILDFNLEEVKEKFKEDGEKAFRADQVFTWLRKGIFDFDEMKNLGDATRKYLKENYYISLPERVKVLESSDGTKKALLKLKDGNIIEAVLMKYEHGYSVCISTQVGCKMGCSFCASTKEGLVRNLTAGEMIGQLLEMGKIANDRISNVVLMGSGEPFDNFDNTVRFLKLVNDENLLNIGQRHITVSTCGIADRIRDFADLDNQVTLAISLHETKEEKRRKLMPVTYKYGLEELMEAIRYYCSKTKRRVSFEYALVKGVNDSLEDANNLNKLLRGIKSHVNLIPLNEIKEGILRKPDGKTIEAFKKRLMDLGMEVTVRREMGQDINAACGQLKRSFLEGGN